MISRLWLWGPAFALMALIFWLSSRPVLPIPGMLTDKQAHGLAYGALAALVFRARSGERLSGLTAANALFAIVVATLYGATDEWHQQFVPGRTADVADLLADLVGATLAAVAIWACGIIPTRRQVRQANPTH